MYDHLWFCPCSLAGSIPLACLQRSGAWWLWLVCEKGFMLAPSRKPKSTTISLYVWHSGIPDSRKLLSFSIYKTEGVVAIAPLLRGHAQGSGRVLGTLELRNLFGLCLFICNLFIRVFSLSSKVFLLFCFSVSFLFPVLGTLQPCLPFVASLSPICLQIFPLSAIYFPSLFRHASSILEPCLKIAFDFPICVRSVFHLALICLPPVSQFCSLACHLFSTCVLLVSSPAVCHFKEKCNTLNVRHMQHSECTCFTRVLHKYSSSLA